MTIATFKYKLAPYGEPWLGKGAYSIVFKATEVGSNTVVAIKKSRVSASVKRPTLQHESQVMQLLKGHSAIPDIYGYGRLEHFECIAMERLGPSLHQQMEGAALMPKTVVQIMDQVLSALEHIHSHGIIHRDIKPDNLLCSLNDPSTIKLIDFGIAKPIIHGPEPREHDLLEERRTICGSLYWASLNSHNGKDLAPRDDLESLAYTALYLLRGNLPWRPRPRLEPQMRSQEIVRMMKFNCTGPDLSTGYPNEFGELLIYSRALRFGQIPNYGRFKGSFRTLGRILDCSYNDPLDWTTCCGEYSDATPIALELCFTGDDDDGSDEDSSGTDTYYASDIDIWDRQGERGKDVTLPPGKGMEMGGGIPSIVEMF